MEVINFQDFIKRDYKKVRKIDYKVLSLPPVFLSPATWFSPPSLVAKGYLIVIGVGFVLVIAALLEMIAASNGHEGVANTIVDFFKLTMPIAFIGALVYFVLTNPLL